ncbi:hypothetical protein [Rubellimicrobium aerolatum]|uniref:Oligosaccharide repeat unit polymerase n=1 Tax=Rubellimicrobium aerolatum TaxID=490979 RepID=A0ABW0S962_9RHOB|nr:hypothetical protein [Rubellimicrobium aerolatum]MBP1804843.1 hypothetical protein [Rubellimicrobium aerolatum]
MRAGVGSRADLKLVFWAIGGYIAVSYLRAVRAVCEKLDNVDFNYATAFDCGTVWSYWWIPALQLLTLWAGYALAALASTGRLRLRRRRIVLGGARVRLRGKSELAFLVLVGILAYCIVKVALDWEVLQENRPGYIARILASKASQFLVLAAALLTAYNLSVRRLGVASAAVALAIGLLFAWVDASRSGVLPPAVIAIHFVARRRVGPAALFLAVAVFFFVLTMTGRGEADKSLDAFLTTATLIASQWREINLSYLFEFSYLHLFTVYEQIPLDFGLADLIYSITPIPGALHPIAVDPMLWRLDLYRPYGGMGELLGFGPVVFGAFHVAFGAMARYHDATPNLFRKFIGLMLFLFGFISLFQYGLRAGEWMIYPSLVFAASARRAAAAVPSATAPPPAVLGASAA